MTIEQYNALTAGIKTITDAGMQITSDGDRVVFYVGKENLASYWDDKLHLLEAVDDD
jgi:hypothetical protein